MTWLVALSQTQRHALIGATAGWAVDGFDFVLYSFVMPTLIAVWGMSHVEAGLIATAALLTSAVGGWLAGMLADRWGRVKVLQITIIWFSVCTFLSGFTNSFEQLAFMRALQGFGFGGEWTVGAVLIAESIEAKNRGKAVGIMQSGYAVGWALATGCFVIAFSSLPEGYAWRALFFIGVVPALLVIYLRSRVVEPTVFLAARSACRGSKRKSSPLEIFGPELLRTTMLASLLAVGIQGAYYAVATWLPTYLRTVRHLPVMQTGGNLFILIAGSFLGYLVGAASMDRWGRRRTFVVFAVLSAGTAGLYFATDLPESLINLAGFPLGFTVCAMVGGLGAFLAELFPTRLRASAQGFAYNSGRAVASTFPPLIGLLSAHYSLGDVTAAFAIGSFVCVITAACLLPETHGRSLENVGAEA